MAAQTFQLTLASHPNADNSQAVMKYYDGAGTETVAGIVTAIGTAGSGFMAIPQEPIGGNNPTSVVQVRASSIISVEGPQ